MIAHIVLFRPRAGLTTTARASLAAAFERALREIPVIRRSRVGRRVTHGRGYEALMREPYDFIAILEFDDVDALKAYLDHPAHADLARQFFDAFDAALMYDFEFDEGGGAAWVDLL